MPAQTSPNVSSPFELETTFALENEQEYDMNVYTTDSFCENGLYAYYPKLILGYIQGGLQTEIQSLPSTFEKYTKCENHCKGTFDLIFNILAFKISPIQGSLCNDIPGQLQCHSCKSGKDGDCMENP